MSRKPKCPNCGNSRDLIYSDPYGKPYPKGYALCACCATPIRSKL